MLGATGTFQGCRGPRRPADDTDVCSFFRSTQTSVSWRSAHAARDAEQNPTYAGGSREPAEEFQGNLHAGQRLLVQGKAQKCNKEQLQ